MVARAAQGLDLSEARRPLGETTKQNFEIPKKSEEPFRLVDGDTTEVVGKPILNYTSDDPRPSLWPAGRARKAVRVLLVLLVLAGGAAWLQSEAGKSQLSKWIGKQNGNVGPQQELPSDANPPLTTKQVVPLTSAPASKTPSPAISHSATGSLPLPDAEKSAETPSSVLMEKATEKPSTIDPKPAPRKAPMTASKDRQAPAAENAAARRKLLEAQVYKAIKNRAITGVTVSIIDDITYLEGQVATERQRDVAERAARSVAGIEQVRNRIAVSVS